MDWALVQATGLWVLLLLLWVQCVRIRSLRKQVRELEWYRQQYWGPYYRGQGRQYWW